MGSEPDTAVKLTTALEKEQNGKQAYKIATDNRGANGFPRRDPNLEYFQ